MNFKKPLSVCLITFLSLSSAIAQDSSAKDERRKAQQERERKALLLLDEVLKESEGLKLAENRVRIQAQVAELLWKRDEKRARSLFKEVMDKIREMAAALDNTDPDFYNLSQLPSQLRTDVLRMMLGHDARLAIEFLRATRLPPPPDNYYNQLDQEADLEMSLAGNIAASDPHLALQVAEESLARGISYQLPQALGQIHANDAQAGARLAAEVLKKLQSESLSSNPVALNVAVNLMSLAIESNAAASAQGQAGQAARSVFDEQATRQLMNIVISAAINIWAAPNPFNDSMRGYVQQIWMSLQSALPAIEKYAPTRAAELRKQLQQFNEASDPRTRSMHEYQELMSKGTVEEFIEAAKRAAPDTRDAFFRQAARNAMSSDDINRARQIIAEHISSPAQRRQAIIEMEQNLRWRAIQQGKADEVRQMLTDVRTSDERARIFVNLATVAEAKGDKKSALELLYEARGQMGSRASNYGEINALLEIAQAYGRLDAARGFEILESLVGQFDQLVAAAAVMEGFEISGYFKEREMMLQPGRSLYSTLEQYMKSLAAFDRADYDRVRTIAGRFERDELRILARLIVAQNTLSAEQQNE
jgi:hypothetical protein